MQSIFKNMKAVNLRRQGKTLVEIEKITGVPKSTLSRWFQKIHLTDSSRELIKDRRRQAMLNARNLAYKARRGFDLPYLLTKSPLSPILPSKL